MSSTSIREKPVIKGFSRSPARVHLLLHTSLADVIVEDNKVTGIVIQGKSGRASVRARCFVDCTGDGDIAAWAGAPFEKNDANRRQPMTLTFIMSHVDLQRAVQEGAAVRLPHVVVEGSELWRSLLFGSYDVDLTRWRDEILKAFPEYGPIITQVNIKDLRDGVYYGGNMLHIPGLDGSDTEELSRAEVESRLLVYRLGQFMRQHVPGFENSFLVSTSARIGVRETRRILGDYYLTYEDVIEGRRFDDVIALGGYRVDIHGYDGGPVYNEPDRGTQIKDYGSYDIPYRCLVPRGVENVIVAGRCISASHIAQGSVRVMGTGMAMGHAAGVAAALCAQLGVSPRQLDVRQFQQKLLEQGANLGERFRARRKDA